MNNNHNPIANWPIISIFIALLMNTGMLFAQLSFSEVTAAAGALYQHGIGGGDPVDEAESGGVAVGDYNNDGHLDLYIVTGTQFPNVLLRNTGAGSFSDETAGSAVAMVGHFSSGPLFADINSDGWQDLLVGGMEGNGYFVFLNNQDETFTNVSGTVGIAQSTSDQNDISSSAGDIDNDGDLDVFIGHHAFHGRIGRNHLWVNDGSAFFTPGDFNADINAWGGLDMSFASTFVDINNDGWQDLLVTADGNESQVYLNDGDGTYTNITTSEIDDRNGMGSAPADYDNDGDIDWFVTAIYFSTSTSAGNRLYMNDGFGLFTDESESAGVRIGSWGWAACAADFDNDGWLDIFHVNGMAGFGESYETDRSRLFINNQDGTFTERSSMSNLNDTGRGKGVVCFDYDEDGAVDLFVANNDGPTRLYHNELANNPGWLQVDVQAEIGNRTTAGSVVEIDIGTLTQHRQLTLGSNFESQNPLRQHFGLGGAVVIDEVRVTWPSGNQRVLTDVGINQILTAIPGPTATEITPETTGPTNLDSVDFFITFDNAVLNFNDETDLNITHSGTSHSGLSISGSGSSYTVSLSGLSGSGSVTLQVSDGSNVQDSVGNPLLSSVTSAAVTIDNTVPLIEIGSPSVSTTTTGPVNYDITYTGADEVTLAIGDISLNVTGDASGTVNVSGSGDFSRTVTLSDITGFGTLGISIAADTASDVAGNSADPMGPSTPFIVTSPNPEAVAITPAAAGPTNADSMAFEVLFNQEMVQFNDASDVMLNHSGTTHGGLDFSGTGASYTVTVNGLSGDGNFTLAVNMASDVENAEGDSLVSSVTSVPVVIDNTPPEISIGSPSLSETADDPFSYIITYSGAESVTLQSSEISLNGTGSADGDISVSGSGASSRTATINHVRGEGTLIISIASGTASDEAGNEAGTAGPSETVNILLGELISLDSFEVD